MLISTRLLSFSPFSLPLSMGTFYSSLYISSLFLGLTYGQSTLPPPGQPTQQAALGTFNIIGSSLVSAQQVHTLFIIIHQPTIHPIPCQLFLGTLDKVYFIDKVENNPTQINGHPAWASGAPPYLKSRVFQVLTVYNLEWALASNTQRPMDPVTNTFCAVGFFHHLILVH